MATPMPVFPAGIATDAQLKVANNLISTTLAIAVDGVSTVLFVASSVGFVVNGLISVDSEIMSITAVSPSQLTVAARGFDGTAAASHSAGAKVSMFIDAWHHNAVAAEIKAIEGFLGPNGQNISSGSPFIVSSAYIFAPQSPGGSLIVGNNVITLSPVPKGVNGTDQNHYLYVSGGTGTAEAALITGGSAVAGAASGTLIINCANTHSGAWTIQTATAGLQEAVITGAPPSTSAGIMIPTGTYQLYQAVTVGGPGLDCFVGSGRGTTVLVQNHPTADAFDFVNEQYCSVESLTIRAASGKTGGAAINVNHSYYCLFRDLIFDTMPNGIITSNGFTECKAFDIQMLNLASGSGAGIWVNNGNIWICDVVMSNAHAAQPAYGIRVTNCGGLFIDRVDIMEAAVGLMIDPGTVSPATDYINQVRVSNVFFDHCTMGVHIFPQQAPAGNITFVNVDCSSAYQYGFKLETYGTGVLTGVLLNGCVVALNQLSGIAIGSGVRDVTIVNSTIRDNSQGTANQYHGIELLNANMTNLVIANNTFGSANQADKVNYFIFLNNGVTNTVIANNSMVNAPGNARIALGTPGANVRIEGNIGYNPVGASAITPGASPFTYTAGPSPEMVYIYGGTVSNISLGSTQIASSSPAQIRLAPHEAITVTYSAAPTMVKDVQ